jgi:hypothetical protein
MEVSYTADIPHRMMCPITHELMRDPVLSRTGHSYERGAIVPWIAKHNSCPLTRQNLRLADLITNHNLRVEIQNWQMQHPTASAGLPLSSLEKNPANTLDNLGKIMGYFDLYITDEQTENSSDNDDDDIILSILQDERRVAEVFRMVLERFPDRRPILGRHQRRQSSTHESNTRGRGFLRRLRNLTV